MHPFGSANTMLATSTLIAALFVSVRAWYARAAFVAASRTRLLAQKRDLPMASPAQLVTAEGRASLATVLNTLSEFFGAQYSVFEGCRLVAKGEV